MHTFHHAQRLRWDVGPRPDAETWKDPPSSSPPHHKAQYHACSNGKRLGLCQTDLQAAALATRPEESEERPETRDLGEVEHQHLALKLG